MEADRFALKNTQPLHPRLRGGFRSSALGTWTTAVSAARPTVQEASSPSTSPMRLAATMAWVRVVTASARNTALT